MGAEMTDQRERLVGGVRTPAMATGRPDYVVGQQLTVEYGPGDQQRFTGRVISKNEYVLVLEDRAGNRTTVRWPHLGYVTLQDHVAPSRGAAMNRWAVWVCPYCGQQYPGPRGHHVAGDDCATSCFHHHEGERGVTQPRLIRVPVDPPEGFHLAPIPHDPAIQTFPDGSVGWPGRPALALADLLPEPPSRGQQWCDPCRRGEHDRCLTAMPGESNWPDPECVCKGECRTPE